ncbi:hypothetical protein [Corynebacterium urealyticum]|uniref:hypothetical protein n=1 Tax=Corynebacterium urealyticum TaxID=43771 RepID=UPI001F29CBC9|nr:hypothetical protein [Corynebacterium urealyticum]
MSACGASPSAKIEEAGGEAAAKWAALSRCSPAVVGPGGRPGRLRAGERCGRNERRIGVRTSSALTIGTLEEIQQGKAARHDWTNPRRGFRHAGTFALACAGEIKLFETGGDYPTDKPVTVATVASTGEVLAGSDTERKIWVFDGGELKDTIDVARETDQLQAVQVDGQRDSVVRTNRFDTTSRTSTGTARAKAAPCASAWSGQGARRRARLVLAADSTGNQLHVYTTDGIIRLQQSARAGRTLGCRVGPRAAPRLGQLAGQQHRHRLRHLPGHSGEAQALRHRRRCPEHHYA